MSQPASPTKAPRKSPQGKRHAQPEPAHGQALDMTLARVWAIRAAQLEEGHSDCFARVNAPCCDKKNCLYHADCLSVSRLLSQPPA